MNKASFRFISLVLLLAILLVNVIPSQALAADQRIIDDIWTQDNGLEALTAQYGKNVSSPFNSYFSNRIEAISPQNGGLVLKETDLKLPGRNGLDLEISRVYRSQQSNLYEMTTAEKSSINWYYVPPTYGYTWTYVPGWTEYQYIPGHYESQWVGGYYDWVYVSGWFEWVFYYDNLTNTFYSGSVYHPGYYDMVFVPGHYEGVYVWGSLETIYHPGYYDYKWGEISPGYYDYYTDYYFDNTTDPKTFLDNVNGLGSGWSFAFPRVENSGNNLFYHNANGDTFQVDFAAVSHLKDYSLQDRVFDNDAGTFSNGQLSSSYVMTYKDGKKEYFGDDGRLLGIVDRYSNTIKFEHILVNGYARISRITDTIGRTVDISYSADRVTVSDGNRTCSYNLNQLAEGKSSLASVTDPANRTTGYQYSLDDASFNFSSQTTRTTNNKYANLIRVSHPTGASTSYSYTKGVKNLGGSGSMEYFKVASRHDTVNGSAVNSCNYSYNGESDGFPDYGKDNLPSTYTYGTDITGPDGTKTSYTYNSDNLEIKKETTGTNVHTSVTTEYAANKTPQKVTAASFSPGGSSSTTTSSTQYNDYNDLVSQVSPDGVITNYTYEDKFHQVTSAEKIGATGRQRIEYTIDAQGNKSSETKYYTKNGTAKTITTLFNYDSYGNCTSARLQMEDGSSRNTSYEYSTAFGSAYPTRITRTSNDGTSSTTSYNYHPITGQKIAETDALGHTTNYSYDKLGRIISVTTPAVEAGRGSKTYSYDDTNNILRVNENGCTTEYLYDSLGRIIAVKDTDGVTIQTRQYDAAGRMSKVTDSSGKSLTAQYDGGGRPVSYGLPDGSSTSISYNDADRTVSAKDPRGNIVTAKTDAAGRTIQISQKPEISGSEVYNTYYSYDFLGNCTKVTQANGKVLSYSYDELGRITGITYPGSQLAPVTFDYNNAGEQVARHDRTTTQYQYNGLGQLVKTIYDDGSYAAFTYDLLGRRTSDFSSASGVSSTYGYDALGRKTAQTKTIDGVNYDLKYRYDLSGNLTGIKYPGDDNFLEYRYDNSNRLTEVEGFIDSSHGGGISYYPSGKNRSITFNNGITTTFAYDGRGRLSALQSPVINENLGYDQSGNITSINDNKFSYDGLNRLVQSEMPSLNQTESYSYDQVGNRTVQTVNGQVLNYSYNSANELVSAGDTAFTFDANGNMTSKTVADTVYGYDFDSGNKLLGISLNGKDISRYSYDADGVRVKKVENGSTTVYVNSGLQYLMTITDNVPVKYIYAQGSRIARVVNGETFYVHTDHLGNTRALTDAQGKPFASMEYSPFGTVMKSDGSDDIFKYTGKELDSSGLYYFGARYYDPAIGRFISKDSYEGDINNPLSMNYYAYVKNNPLVLVDPNGCFWEWFGNAWNAISGFANNAWNTVSNAWDKVDGWETVRGGLQTAGGLAEMGVGFGLCDTLIGAPLGAYLIADGASNVLGGGSNMSNGLFGTNYDLNFMRYGYISAFGPEWGNRFYTGSQFITAGITIGNSFSRLPSALASDSWNVGINSAMNGARTVTSYSWEKPIFNITTRTESSLFMKSWSVNTWTLGAGIGSMGVDVYNTYGTYGQYSPYWH